MDETCRQFVLQLMQPMLREFNQTLSEMRDQGQTDAEIAAMLRNEMSPKEVIERGAAATRQYAKRQMTWFRNQMDESWERVSP